MRNQLIKLMRDSDIAEDLRKIHVVRSSGYPMALLREDMTFIAASKEACDALSVDIDEIEGLSYRSHASEDVERKFRVAQESGFFAGDVASIDYVTHGYALSGEDIFFRSLWSPERLCDGTYAAMVIAKLLSRREYEQQRREKGALRIVTMADLVGKHEVGV